jgi:hypothetical protein
MENTRAYRHDRHLQELRHKWHSKTMTGQKVTRYKCEGEGEGLERGRNGVGRLLKARIKWENIIIRKLE